ncbi:MAG: TonB-dependent receptor [Pseudomonadota bacterium]
MAHWKYGCALSVGALFAAGALAQDADTPDQEARQDTVIVTGQKIERSLQDTQASVEVITELDIEQENILDLVDAIERTANITTNDGSSFTIRGVNSTSVSGAGQGNLATIYVDGVALPRQALFGSPVEIFDISQIELLRGPQSTLQGRASLAGAIIVNTANPTYEWTGRARAIYTTEEERTSLAGAIGGPIIPDQVAFRIAAEHTESDGFSFNPILNEPSDPIESSSIRGKLLIEPAAIPGLEVVLSYTQQESSDGDSFNSLNVTDPAETREIPLNTPTRFMTNVDIATAVIDYEINDRWSVTSLTGWNQVDYNTLVDFNRDPVSTLINTFDTQIETRQQELRLAYAGDEIEFIVGGFVSEEETPFSTSFGAVEIDLERDLNLTGLLQLPPFGLDAGTAGFVLAQYPLVSTIATTSEFSQSIETWAIYTDGSWEIADNWTLYGGFRYDNETQSNVNEALVEITSPLPDPTLFPAPLNQVIGGVNGFLQAGAADASAPRTSFSSPEFGGFLPKLGVGYDFTDDVSASFTIQRGYRSGGAAINAARAEAYDFDQEFTWNYELAFRSQWFDRALTLNANAFYVDWTDQQVRVQLSDNVFDTEIQNAGGSTLFGFEIESSYDVDETLDVYGSIGYSKTEFDEFIVTRNAIDIDFAGNEFGAAPQWTVNAGATWRPTDNLIGNINANYVDSAFLRGDDFQLRQEIDSRTLVNFRAGWENDSFGIYLTGSNLFDEDYVISQFPNLTGDADPALPPSLSNATPAMPNFAQYGDPRTFSIQLEARF